LQDTKAITAPKMTALDIGRFAGSGVGNVSKYLTGFCGRRGPKRHTLLTHLTIPTAYEISGRQNKLLTLVRGSGGNFEKSYFKH
jgi:hypothetical protein